MDEIARQTWMLLGEEAVTFGSRWVVVSLAVALGAGWFGKRYRKLKQDVADLQERLDERDGKAAEPPPKPRQDVVLVLDDLHVARAILDAKDWTEAERIFATHKPTAHYPYLAMLHAHRKDGSPIGRERADEIEGREVIEFGWWADTGEPPK